MGPLKSKVWEIRVQIQIKNYICISNAPPKKKLKLQKDKNI